MYTTSCPKHQNLKQYPAQKMTLYAAIIIYFTPLKAQWYTYVPHVLTCAACHVCVSRFSQLAVTSQSSNTWTQLFRVANKN